MRWFLVLVAACLTTACSGSAPKPDAPPVESASGVPGCQSPLGFISEGHSATGYLHQIESRGEHCQQGTLTCQGGAWTGPYIYPSCVVLP
jgi:hypothetical protein